jgi:hypothetical protein
MEQRYFVTGGQYRKDAWGAQEWVSFRQAQIFKVDVGAGQVEQVASYESPPEHRPDDPEANIIFKAGSLDGDSLHVCTQTEILTYSRSNLELQGCLSHPWFNDLHHVVVGANGNFLVAVTGLDLVMEITKAGEVVRDWAIVDGNTWQRFDRDTDYRKVVTTKPHQAHPNYVFFHRGEIWATRFIQKDAIRLTGQPGGIEAQGEKLHDGCVVGDKVYLTSVDGHLVIADLVTGKTIRTHDFNAMSDSDRILGWCRGLHVLDENRVVVGFSRLRPSKFRENVQWVKFQLGLRVNPGKLGTRIACYDLRNETLEWDFDLEAHGMNAIFSILPA